MLFFNKNRENLEKFAGAIIELQTKVRSLDTEIAELRNLLNTRLRGKLKEKDEETGFIYSNELDKIKNAFGGVFPVEIERLINEKNNIE